MRIDILTLFPEMVDNALSASIIGRARGLGLVEIQVHNIRDFGEGAYNRVDDYPYGGGLGMVMKCDPLYNSHQSICQGEHIHTILLSAQGATFCQKKACQLLERDRFILVCGHYEGVDQRFIDECVDEEISIGDFVLTGGELAAMIVSDAVCRLIPGVLSENASFTEESYYSGTLEQPQYTRPEIWHERAVPAILLSGHHANIKKWQRKQSLERTRDLRPDMFAKLELDKTDKKLLEEK